MSSPMIAIAGLNKIYASGHAALKSIDLDIQRGEIFALLGPNGAGKTTLIGIICGIVNPGAGQVSVNGFDVCRDYRQARSEIGLVPQELCGESFESVWATVRFSRGLFGKPSNDAYLEQLLKELSLWNKKDARVIDLSGGMKRRVMIAKALSHEPSVLFLDEPTAGVDVELRRDMWAMVRGLRDRGVTIILTTHYIEEAEEMADRIGVIREGQIILVEEKERLMRQLGKRELILQLQQPLSAVPEALARYPLSLTAEGMALVYTFDTQGEHSADIANLLRQLGDLGINFRDLQTRQSSLEEILVGLLKA